MTLDSAETVGEVMRHYYALLQKDGSSLDKYLDETAPGGNARGESALDSARVQLTPVILF